MIIEPIRLFVAAHELGHALVWEAAAIPTQSIRIWGEAPRVRGFVELDGGEITSSAEMRAYLIGVLAGEYAGERWQDENRAIRGRLGHDCDFDRRNYRRQRQDPLARALRDSELRQAARSAVSKQWARICALTPRLAEVGRIRL